MQLFYNPDITPSTDTLTFDKEESRHIIKVMRKSTGDNVYVTNGLGYIFKTEIVIASDNKCIVRIVSFEVGTRKDYRLHLAVAPTKMNDRFEWFLEKATEMGVDEITPLICDRSERKFVKIERFHKIIHSAMKQSLQSFLPKLNEPAQFSDFVKSGFNGQKFIAHCDDSSRSSLKESIKMHTDTLILIGPEGDFTGKEIKLALEENYKPVSMGNTRLRTETAALVACHSVVFQNES